MKRPAAAAELSGPGEAISLVTSIPGGKRQRFYLHRNVRLRVCVEQQAAGAAAAVFMMFYSAKRAAARTAL